MSTVAPPPLEETVEPAGRSRLPAVPGWVQRLRDRRRGESGEDDQPARGPRRPPTTQSYATGIGLVLLAVLLVGLALNVVLLSRLQYDSAQRRGFDQLRNELALGTAPLGQTDARGRLLSFGTPVALITIPKLGLDKVVVFEGTTSSVLMSGPGHQRNSVLPGQAGTSVVQGRAAAYGGPFAHLKDLQPGDTITTTTGVGSSTFTVLDLRKAGDPGPTPLTAGKGRLLLITADGPPFVPTGVLRVDASLTSQTLGAPPMVLAGPGAIADSEKPMGTDTTTVWALVLWLQALLVVSIGAVWAWFRWGAWQSWIVFFPVGLAVALQMADQVSKLLPNLL